MARGFMKFATVLAAAALSLCMAPMAFADFAYPQLKEDLPIADAVGSYDLVDADGAVLQTLKFEGEGTVSLSFDEPGDYTYTLKSKDTVINTADYSLTVQVVSDDSKLSVGAIALTRLDTGEKVDKIRTLKLQLVKVSTEDQAKLLEGAQFALFKPVAVDKDGKLIAGSTPVATAASGKDGMALLGNLQPGVYYLKEVKAPEGFVGTDKLMKIQVSVENQSGSITPLVTFDAIKVQAEKDGSFKLYVANKPEDKPAPDPGPTPEPTPDPDKPGVLPQTGQLWWPVPVMILGGLALLSLGLFMKRRENQ